MVAAVQQVSALPPGNLGTTATLCQMARLVREDALSAELREFAHSLIAGCGGHDFACEVQALFSFVRDQITFRYDPMDMERISGALQTLQDRTGDCDDKVICLASLLAVCGHVSRFVTVSFDGKDWNHVYLEVLSRDGWIALDPTSETAAVGWEPPGVVRRQVYPIWKGASTWKCGLGFLLIAGAILYW